LLFTGKGGEQHGYVDGWQPDGNYYYTGEGQIGDMRFIGGNRAVRDHSLHRKDLHLFEQTGKAFVRYLGEFECAGSHLRSTTGTDGKTRSAIVFDLTVVFTVPPLAAVGFSERGAREQNLKFRVKTEMTSTWYSTRRVVEAYSGYKVLVEESTDLILGAHILGSEAGEVINLFALAIRSGIRATDLKHMLFAYPTSGSNLTRML